MVYTDYNKLMTTITIPEKLIKEKDLMVIPRKEYEALLKTQKNSSEEIVVKRSKSFKVPKRHEKFYDNLDKELTQILREVKQGKIVGPFSSTKELKQSLER